VVCLISAALLGILAPSAFAVGPSDLEREQVELINDFRAENGLRPLAIDGTLSKAARWMANAMPANNFFAHDDHLGRHFDDRLADFNYPSDTYRGENLAAGYPDAANTFRQWKESPGHRANMLTRDYTAIGIALVDAPGSTYGYYWVTEFGSRVVSAVPGAKVQARLEKMTAADRRKVRRIARRCERSGARNRGRAAAKQCRWNTRTARHLDALGL
jgi:hypothetical protein